MTPMLMNRKFFLEEVANLLLATGTLFGAKLDLYKNAVVYNPDVTLLADLTVCTFAGYAQAALTWDAVSVSDDGHVETHSSRATFRATDAVTPNDAYGYFVTDAAGNLIGGGTFDNGPLPFHSALDVALTTLVFRPEDGTSYCDVVS